MASDTMKEEKFNDYRKDLEVFEDLLLMSDEEIDKERKAAQDILEMRPEKNKEKEELEAYFAELDQKEVVTGIERLQRMEKEKRYNQILEAETPNAKVIEEAVASDKFISELERYAVFTKVRELLSMAEKTIVDARNSKAAKLREARREFKVAREQDNVALFNINKKLEELDNYFEDFFKKEYTTEEEQKEFEEKKQLQKELLEAKINFPSQATIDARNNVEDIERNSEENEVIDKARQKIKFLTDRGNWNQILAMSKEELMDFVNGKETSIPKPVEPTTLEQAPAQEKEEQSQEGAEAKTDGDGKQDQVEGKGKKEIKVKTTSAVGRGEAPVVSDGNEKNEEEGSEGKNEEEKPEGEQKDLTDPKRSVWERIKGLFAKPFTKNKEKANKKVRKIKREKLTKEGRKEKQNRIYKKYIDNYKAMYKQEPGWIDKTMARIAPNFFAQVRNVIEYKESINPEDYKGTQAEELVAKVDEKGQGLERVEGEIVTLDENSEINYEGTQAQELAEKVAASKRIGENSWDRTSSYTEKMTVEQVVEQEDNLKTIDEYYEQKSNPVVRVDTDYRDDFSDEPKKVEAVIRVNTDYKDQNATIEDLRALRERELAKAGKEDTSKVTTKKAEMAEWKGGLSVRTPEDMKQPGIATFGKVFGRKTEPKLDLESIMTKANEVAKAKANEFRGEVPNTTGAEHGDGDR